MNITSIINKRSLCLLIALLSLMCWCCQLSLAQSSLGTIGGLSSRDIDDAPACVAGIDATGFIATDPVNAADCTVGGGTDPPHPCWCDGAVSTWKATPGSAFTPDADPAVNHTMTAYALLASPALTGNPTVPTASADDSDTSAASTAYVQQEINGAGGTDLTCSAGVCNVDNPVTSASTAAALAANGANCAAGSYPLGVDAAGAVESCTDASTETDSIVATHAAIASAHHAATVDTGPSPDCSGTTTYQDGEGGCDDISSIYEAADADIAKVNETEVITGDWDFGGGGLEIENGTTPPACTSGQIYQDTDATSGQQLMACEAGTFVAQGGGGGGGTSIADADGDTKVQTEESADEDIIRFDAKGEEVMTIANDGTDSQVIIKGGSTQAVGTPVFVIAESGGGTHFEVKFPHATQTEFASDSSTFLFDPGDDNQQFVMNSGEFYGQKIAQGPTMLNEAASATNPTFAPSHTDFTTGLGWVSTGVGSIIGGSVSAATFSATNFGVPVIFSGGKQSTTLGAAATTFAVTTNLAVLTGDGGGNTLATITGGASGQVLRLLFVDGLVTITDTDAHTANTIDLSAAFTSADDTVLTLLYDGTSWYETARSAN